MQYMLQWAQNSRFEGAIMKPEEQSRVASDYREMSDEVWSLVEERLPIRKGGPVGSASDNRAFVNGVFWVLKTGAHWRELPAEYGNWKNIHRRFCRWRDRGGWENILELLMDVPDYAWLVEHGGAPAAAPPILGRSRKANLTLKYDWPWLRMLCRSENLLRKMPWMFARRRRPRS
jgi:transposase